MGCSNSKAVAVWEPGPEAAQAPKRPKAANGRDCGVVHVDTEPAELTVSVGAALAAAAAPALSGSGEGGAWEQEAADLEDLGRQVLGHCASITDGESVGTAEGLADFAGGLVAGAEGAFKALDSFGPVGPLFKSLGMFAHHVMEVRDSRVEGRRLKVWAETLIPIIRRSVPVPFPADMDAHKREELTQCTGEAVRAIEELQRAIQEVARTRESWVQFLKARRYIDGMEEAQKRVETAIDIIQKHLIADTKHEVCKITAMLKGFWGRLTDMETEVKELRGAVEAGFAEMRAELKTVNSKLDKQDGKLDKQASKLDKLAVEQGSKLDKQGSMLHEQGKKLDQIITLASNVSRAAGILQAGDQQPASQYAMIPPEVPELPAAFQARPALLAELKQLVLSMTTSTTSLVGVSRGAAAATTSAHGMGGVGKTTIAVQLIRDPEVGAAFKRLLWVSVSQEPDIFGLIRVLYYQLTSRKLPASAEEERDAVQELRQAAKGKRVLLVLDDCWDAKHGELLNCVDADAGSACVITTRIRNLAKGEVSCGLLSFEVTFVFMPHISQLLPPSMYTASTSRAVHQATWPSTQIIRIESALSLSCCHYTTGVALTVAHVGGPRPPCQQSPRCGAGGSRVLWAACACSPDRRWHDP